MVEGGQTITIEDNAAIVGLVLTTIGLLYTGNQIRLSRKVARGEFLLHLDEMFQGHNATQSRFRPAGDWGGDGTVGPNNVNEWENVEKYMGLFERVNVLIKDEILDIDTFDRLYGYRIINIVKNDIVREAKLTGERAENWHDFIELYNKTIETRGRRLAQQTQQIELDYQE